MGAAATRISTLTWARSPNIVVGMLAVLTASVVFLILSRQASMSSTGAGFWFEAGTYRLPADSTTKLGGPLTRDEIAAIERIARSELERAFVDLRISFNTNRNAFWRVAVVQAPRGRGPLPVAGQSFGLGPLGGRGVVGFEILASNGVAHAPPDATRSIMIDAIGRGIGRAAAHEFAHQILGTGVAHDYADADSYEYYSSNRASQYYGDLHWSVAWPLLQRKLGR